MQQLDQATEKSAKVTAISPLPPSQIGEKSNTKNSKKKGTIEKKSLLREAADGLASYLELYAKYGGNYRAATLKTGEHIIILPASFDPETDSYSLLEVKDKSSETGN